MAERRMMAKSVIETDAFMDMPFSSQALYFHLLLRADNDGFIMCSKSIIRQINASEADMKMLIDKSYAYLLGSGLVVNIGTSVGGTRAKKKISKDMLDKIFTLRQDGWSKENIAKELRIDKRRVTRIIDAANIEGGNV